jgi:peptidyl-dipeptidase Dcp
LAEARGDDRGDSNPLLEASGLPFAAPPFDRSRPEHFLPAFRRVIEEAWRDVRAIADDDSPPTFVNVIAALERAGPN